MIRDGHVPTFQPFIHGFLFPLVYTENNVYSCLYSGGLQQEVYILRLFFNDLTIFVNHFSASVTVDSHCEFLACSCISVCNTKYAGLVIFFLSVIVSHVYLFWLGC